MPATNFNILTGLNVGNVTTDAAANSVATSGNITAGNLASTGLTSTASFTVSGNSNLGAVGNVTLTGGAANQVLITNGSGVLSFTNVNALVGTISSAVANQVTYYTAANTLSGSSNLTWNGANLLTVTGNVSASNFSTSGTLSVSGNANVGNLGATNANLSAATIVGNLATGNTSATLFTGNITGTSGVFSGNVTFGNINAVSGILGVSGNITGGNLITTGFLNVSGNANVGNLGTAGNITASYFFGNGSQLTGITVAAGTSIVNGTSNVTVVANGNVTTSVAGTANVLVVTSTGANVTGTLNVTGNANVGNLGTAGNITASYFFGNGSQLTGITAGGNSSSIVNGTSNVTVVANGNVTTSVAGTANVLVVTSTGTHIKAGSATSNGQLTIQAGDESYDSHLILGTSYQAFTAGTNYNKTAIVARGGTGYSRADLHFVLNSSADTSSYIVGTNTKMIIKNNGNVGIGNTAPAHTLSVTGTLSVSGSAAFDTNTLYVDATNHRVGIGTSAPATDLHIRAGSATSNGRLTIQAGDESYDAHLILGTPYQAFNAGNNYNKTAIVARGGTGYSRADLHFVLNSSADTSSYTVGTDTRMIIKNNGNVGIGNTAPAHTLSVTGTLNVSGNANVGNIGASYFVGNGSQLTGITAAPSPSVVNGTSNLVVTANGNVTTSVAGTANVLVVTSTGANVAGTFNATGNTIVGGTFNASSLTVSGSAAFDTNTLYVDAANNRVGIGTSAPATDLHIRAGSATSNGRLTIQAADEEYEAHLILSTSYQAFTSGNNYNKTAIVADGIDSWSRADLHFVLNDWGDNNSYTVGTDSKMIIKNNGNVGIGTSNIGARLTVVCGDSATANSQVSISGGRSLGAGADGSAGAILFTNSYWNSGYGAARISASDSGTSGGHLIFSTTANGGGVTGAPTEKMRILQNGNVGIGTSTPGALLSFGSGVNDNKINLYEGTNDKYGFGIRANQLMIYSGAGGSGSGGITLGKFDGTTFTERMRVTNDGNVGIGNTAPTHTLRVEGTISATGNANVGNIGATSIVGTLTTASQTNITSLGTLTSLTVSGNISIGSLGVAIDSSKNFYPGNQTSNYFTWDGFGISKVGSGYFYISNGIFYVQSTSVFRGVVSNDQATYLQINGGTSGHTYFNGNVGVGISGPVARLQSAGATLTATPTGGSATGTGLYINGTDTTYGMMFGISSDGGGWIQQQRSDANNTQYALRLNPLGGFVGIGMGSTNPGKTLDIISAAGSIRLAQTTSSGYGYIELGRSATATNNWHIGSENDGTFRFYNGTWGAGTLRLYMTSVGETVINGGGGGLTIINNNPTISFQDTDGRSAFIHCNSNLLYVLRGSGSNVGYGSWTSVNAAWPLVINLETNTATFGGLVNTDGTNSRFATGYDSGQNNSMSCSNWFRSSGTTGWYNATYDGGIWMSDSTYVRVYNNKGLAVDGQISARYGQSSGSVANATGGLGGLECLGGGSTNAAFMTFHRPGLYAVYFGLDGTDLKVGGWSMGAVAYTMMHSGNYTTYTGNIPQESKTSAYTLVAADRGKHISITTGGVTVPASVFNTGDIVTIYNNSGSNQTITQGASTTLRFAGTANTGNRTLAQYGVATVLCVASNTFVISGNGLT